MAEAEGQLQVLALQRRAVTNAVDFELALVTVLNTLQDVLDHRAGHAPLRTSILGVIDRLYDNSVVFELHGDFVICDEEKFTLRALDGDLLAFDRGGHASRNRNGLLTDTRHSFYPVCSLWRSPARLRRRSRVPHHQRSVREPGDRHHTFGVERMVMPRPFATCGMDLTET